MSNLHGIEDLKESQEKRKIARDLYYLKDLILGINYFEPNVTLKELDRRLNNKNFKGSILIASSKGIYRHASILILSKYFDRGKRYKIFPCESIVDIWWSNLDNPDRQDLLKADIAILHSEISLKNNKGPLKGVLKEIFSVRRSYNKTTLLFSVETEPDGQSLISEFTDFYNNAYSFMF